MSTLLHILKYKILSFAKTTFDLRAVAVVRGIGSLLVFGGFAIGAYVLSHEVTKYLLEETRTGLFLFHRFISMLLFVFFVSVNLGNIIVSFATLYKSPEVVYLFTKPLEYSTVFVMKFLDNFLYSSTTLFLVGFMVLWGYGSYLGYSWYAMLGMLFFILIPYMLLSACLAVLILMALMKTASRWGFRRVVAGLTVTYLSLVYAFFKFSNPVKLVEEVGKYYPNVNLYLANLDPSFMKYLPNHWVSEFLFWLSKGSWEQAFPFAALLVAVTAAFFVLVLLVANRFYYKSWVVAAHMQTGAGTVRSLEKVRFLDFRKESRLPRQIEVLIKKDFFQFFREPSQWIHFALMVVLITVFVLSVRRLNFMIQIPELPAFTYLVIYAFGGFLTAALTLRFVFPMLSLEGNSFWSLLSAPISSRTMYFTKFVVALLGVMTVGIVVSYFSNLPFAKLARRDTLLLVIGLVSAIWVSLSMVSLNLGFGGYFVNFQEKNPIRIASSQGATLTFLLNLVLLVVMISILVLPLSRYFESLLYFRPFGQRIFLVPGIVFSIISMMAVSLGLLVGLRSLKRDF